jgi:hypothetical protein
MEQASRVNAYYKVIFLIFFKASVQEDHAMEALNKKDINGLEQSRVSLLKYADEGLAKLDTIKPFKGDGALINATRKVLDFYRQEATKDLPVFADYIIKGDEFERLKKSYDAKSSAKSQADVGAYNKAVNEFNKLIGIYNKTSQQCNGTRANLINNWNIVKARFMDAHIPHK